MSSFFKIFKDPEPVEQEPESKPATAKTSSFNTTSFESLAPTVVAGDVDADYKQGFAELLTTGDYYNFSGALTTLDTLPLEESQKYNAAFKTISMYGVTVEKILNAAASYLEVVQAQEREFQANLQDRKKTDIEDKEQAILKDQQLIQEATERINTARIQVNQSKLDLTKKEASFNATYKAVVDEVEAKIQKIKTYINNEFTK